METVCDVYPQAAEVQARQILLSLPEEAAQPAMEREDGEKLYLCNGYELRVQTLPSGNLTGTLRTVTGFTEDEMTVIQTMDGENTRYDCVWCTVGETGDQVGRTAVIDDGSYYYCVSVLADSAEAGKLRQTWQTLLDSFFVA